jgi:hypothetical protein
MFKQNISEGTVTLLKVRSFGHLCRLTYKITLCESISKTKWLLLIFAQITIYRKPYKKKCPQLRMPYSGNSEFGLDSLFHKAEGKIEHIYCKV